MGSDPDDITDSRGSNLYFWDPDAMPVKMNQISELLQNHVNRIIFAILADTGRMKHCKLRADPLAKRRCKR